jgi:hypothetical protein
MPRSSKPKTAPRLAALLAAVAASVASMFCNAQAQAAPLDPNSFSSLGTLNIGGGSITIDTDALSITGAATFNGATFSQGNGAPDVAVFSFGSLNIGAGVTINVVGTRPLALLSQSAMSIASPISVSGSDASSTAGGAAGAGGYGGGTGGTTGSFGSGPGGGGGVPTFDHDGGGAGFGGAGGSGFTFSTPGASYGDLLIALQGGSGGGGGKSGSGNAGGGGGGGGAIELGAVEAMTLSSSVTSNGGTGANLPFQGGGGAGGGILLHAATFTLSTLQAAGGAGPISLGAGGGGGGGGRIALAGGKLDAAQVNAAIASFSSSVNGGAGWTSGQGGVLTIRPDFLSVEATQSVGIGVSNGLSRIEVLPTSFAVQNGGTVTLVSPLTWVSGNAVSLAGGLLDVASSSTFSSGSAFNWSAGSMSIANGQTLAFDGGVGTVTAGGRGLTAGATLRISGGGQFSSNSYFDIGSSADPGNGPSGTLLVDGAGSRFSSDSALWGYNPGDFATVALSNQGAATINVVQIATNGGQALVDITSGATLNISSLSVGNTNSGASATININGGALRLYGTGVSASLREGSSVNLSSGTFSLAGNGTFSRSSFNWSGGTLLIAPQKTLTISGATVTLNNIGAGLARGATLQILNGGVFAGGNYFDIANFSGPVNGPVGTLLIDGANSRMNLTGTSYWGYNNSDFATVTISNQGMGSFGGLTIAGNGGQVLVNITSGGTLNVDAPLVGSAAGASAATININGGALKIGLGATFRQGAIVNFSSGTFVDSGTLILSDNAKILLTPSGDKVVRSGVVSMSGTSKIDLADNDMIVDYSGSSQLPTIKGYLIAGRNGGNWTGSSLTSSSAALDPNHSSLGYGEASDVLGAGGGTFDGVPVDGTAVLVKFTYLGDANLDGMVDLKDLYRLAINYNAGGKLWTSGDFNYDGLTNVQDLTALAINWQAGVGAPLGMSITQALARLGLPQITVPEPGMLCAIIGPYILWRRRKAGRRQSRP